MDPSLRLQVDFIKLFKDFLAVDKILPNSKINQNNIDKVNRKRKVQQKQEKHEEREKEKEEKKKSAEAERRQKEQERRQKEQERRKEQKERRDQRQRQSRKNEDSNNFYEVWILLYKVERLKDKSFLIFLQHIL